LSDKFLSVHVFISANISLYFALGDLTRSEVCGFPLALRVERIGKQQCSIRCLSGDDSMVSVSGLTLWERAVDWGLYGCLATTEETPDHEVSLWVVYIYRISHLENSTTFHRLSCPRLHTGLPHMVPSTRVRAFDGNEEGSRVPCEQAPR
jgi:hypothetical protein